MKIEDIVIGASYRVELDPPATLGRHSWDHPRYMQVGEAVLVDPDPDGNDWEDGVELRFENGSEWVYVSTLVKVDSSAAAALFA